jgi:hypothetical protein
MRTRSRHGYGIAMLVCCLLVAATLSNDARATAPQATRIVFVSPVDAVGHLLPGYRIVATVHGSCDGEGSEWAASPAYHCGSGNGIYEACWPTNADPRRAIPVVCLFTPWSHTVVRIDTNGLPALENEEQPSRRRLFPWGVQLTTGQRCLLDAGARSEFNGHVIDYHCGSRYEFLLLRPIDQDRPLWSFGSVRWPRRRLENGHVVFEKGPTVYVQTAWFGR